MLLPKDSAEWEISWPCYLFHEAVLDMELIFHSLKPFLWNLHAMWWIGDSQDPVWLTLLNYFLIVSFAAAKIMWIMQWNPFMIWSNQTFSRFETKAQSNVNHFGFSTGRIQISRRTWLLRLASILPVFYQSISPMTLAIRLSKM